MPDEVLMVGLATVLKALPAIPSLMKVTLCTFLVRPYCRPADRGSSTGNRQLGLEIGTGAESSHWYSLPFQSDAGVWQHVAFTYDGAGTVEFLLMAPQTVARRNPVPDRMPVVMWGLGGTDGVVKELVG